jgi:hypothetical protein
MGASKMIDRSNVSGIDLTDKDLDGVSGGDKNPPLPQQTTMGGTAIGRGHSITNGGNNGNLAASPSI